MVRQAVFISSTYADLVDHRARVAEVVERLGQHGVRMEVFGARTAAATTASLEEVEECDIFVGIYAHRYGCVPPGSTTSITRMEFERARQLNKPMFCYVVDQDHSWPPRHIEEEPGRTLLVEFKKELATGSLPEPFTTPEDLAFKVAAALGRYLLRELPGTHEELDRFRQRAAGYWWSRGADLGSLGLVSLVPDQTASTLAMSGRAFDSDGKVIAVWESAASCIYLERRKLYYYWHGWWPERPTATREGFGELSFHDTADGIDRAVGVFFDNGFSDVAAMVKKSCAYRRCSQSEIEVMLGASTNDIRALVRRTLSAW